MKFERKETGISELDALASSSILQTANGWAEGLEINSILDKQRLIEGNLFSFSTHKTSLMREEELSRVQKE